MVGIWAGLRLNFSKLFNASLYRISLSMGKLPVCLFVTFGYPGLRLTKWFNAPLQCFITITTNSSWHPHRCSRLTTSTRSRWIQNICWCRRSCRSHHLRLVRVYSIHFQKSVDPMYFCSIPNSHPYDWAQSWGISIGYKYYQYVRCLGAWVRSSDIFCKILLLILWHFYPISLNQIDFLHEKQT